MEVKAWHTWVSRKAWLDSGCLLNACLFPSFSFLQDTGIQFKPNGTHSTGKRMRQKKRCPSLIVIWEIINILSYAPMSTFKLPPSIKSIPACHTMIDWPHQCAQLSREQGQDLWENLANNKRRWREACQVKSLFFRIKGLLRVRISHWIAHVHLLPHHLSLIYHFIPEK